MKKLSMATGFGAFWGILGAYLAFTSAPPAVQNHQILAAVFLIGGMNLLWS